MRIGTALALSALMVLPVHAAPTTSTGRISVTQVMEMVDLARTDAKARNTIIAYLAGIGETAGLMVSEAVAPGPSTAPKASISRKMWRWPHSRRERRMAPTGTKPLRRR